MSTFPFRSFVGCNGADVAAAFPQSLSHERLPLEYRSGVINERNLNIHLPQFIGAVNYVPDRLLDLLEIASYVYGADRNTHRGSKNDVEYHKWSREYHFAVRVRDYDFWRQPEVLKALNDLLSFLSGNLCYHFTFEAGHSTAQATLFDKEEFAMIPNPDARVVLFSGGLDSLAGVVEMLDTTVNQLYLVSHRSGQPATGKTQDKLLEALRRPDPTRPNLQAGQRLNHYRFGCSLKGERAKEETQRTRFFLYTSIAFVLARLLNREDIVVYENGLTSLNFPKRQDLMLGRASRTTHPRTITGLNSLFSLIAGTPFRVETPYFWKTKTDVLKRIGALKRQDLISSAVSCSKTFKINTVHKTHCGGCSQCVDRRFAAWAAELDERDECGIYALDFVTEPVVDSDVQTMLRDFVRQAKEFMTSNIDNFYTNRATELSDICDYLGNLDEEVAIDRLWQLCHRHGEQVKEAARRMRAFHDDPFSAPARGSFLDMLRDRDYLQDAKGKSMNSTTIDTRSCDLFFSYCHADETLRDELAKYIILLERQGIIRRWHDRKIGAGKELNSEINEHLNAAGIILLLISADFLASDYCYNKEMKRAMERHDNGEARVIPVILRECDWQIGDFAKLLALPTDGKAVTSRHWHNHDEAFTNVAQGIRKAVEEWRSE